MISATASGTSASGTSGARLAVRALLQQPADVARLQGRYPVQPRGLQVLADARRREHAPVARERHAVDAEAGADLLHLARHSGRIGRVPGEDLHRHRAAVRGTEQAVDDLHLSLLPVAAVAEGRQRAAPSLQMRAGNVVQDQRVPALQVPVGQAPLDPRLALQQPVEHVEHLVAGDGAEPEQGPEAAGRGLRVQRPGGGELRGGVEDPRGDGGERKVPHAVRLPAEDADHAERAERSKHRRRVAVGARPADGDGRVERRERHAAAEGGADGVDECGRHLREVGDGSPPDALPSRHASRRRTAGLPCLTEMRSMSGAMADRLMGT